MPSSARHRARPRPAAANTVEVATTYADVRRARVRIIGVITGPAAALLTTVLNTHLRAGRCHLRVDLAAAQPGGAALRRLADAADTAAALGGALVIENAPPWAAQAFEAFRRTPVHA